jgi:hypothetical protein
VQGARATRCCPRSGAQWMVLAPRLMRATLAGVPGALRPGGVHKSRELDSGVLMARYDTIRFVPVEVAGRPSKSPLLHREDCFHLRDQDWPEPILREATDEERRTRRQCSSCIAREQAER